MHILVINGPNLNLLGKREPGIYGKEGFESFLSKAREEFPGVELTYYQSNIEGELIDRIQEADGKFDGVILNAGGYTHTSIALGDAIAAVTVPVVEVHISNIYAREQERHLSFISKSCIGSIAGFGLDSYRLAIRYFLDYPFEEKPDN